jgi:AraC-like DNA-binding protein/mannose-6-phosphate isomerase-like protein (cupin superfamily)
MNWLERLNRLPVRVPLPESGGDAILDIGHWAYSAHLPDNVPHRHAYFEVCRVGKHGQGQYLVEGVPYTIEPGDLFFSRPGVLHQIVNTEQTLMELFWVTFYLQLPNSGTSEQEVAALLRRFAEASEVLVVPDSGGSVHAAWEALRVTATSDMSGSAVFIAQINALSVALLLSLALAGGGREESNNGPSSFTTADDRVGQRAVRYIHDNLSRPLTVPEIAAQANVSPRHLTRLFSRFTGVPPAAYIEKARLQRARTLLLKTDDPVKQIGAQVGYEDVHHFTRVFTRLVGCPPGAFRKTRGAAATPILDGPYIQKPGTLV